MVAECVRVCACMHARQCDSLSVWYRGSVLMGESEYVHVRESVRARSRVCVCACVRVFMRQCAALSVAACLAVGGCVAAGACGRVCMAV